MALHATDGRLLDACTTDASGRCGLEGPPGPALVRPWSDAHLPLEVEVVLVPGAPAVVPLSLEPAGATVLVEDRAAPPVPEAVELSGEEVRQVPGALGDPVRALQGLPSVARSNFLDGRLVVRGAEGLATQVRLDGVPLPALFHFFVGRSVVHPALVEELDLLPGGLPARYGDVAQAVLEVRTARDAPHQELAVDLLDGSALLRVRDAAGWRVHAAGRVGWIGPLLGLATRASAALSGAESDPARLELTYGDLAGTARRALGEGWTLEAGWVAASDTLRYVPAEDATPEEEPPNLPYDPDAWLLSRWARVHLAVERRLPGVWSRTLLAGGPDLRQNLLGLPELSGLGPFLGLVEGWTAIARHAARRAPREGFALESGIELRWTDALATDTSDVALLGEAGLVRTWDRQLVLGAWFAPEGRLGRTTLTAGTRILAASWSDRLDTGLEPRLGIERPVAPGWNVHLHVGRYLQVPPLEAYAAGMGTPGLPPIDATQVTAGARGRLPGGWEVQAGLYGTAMGDTLVEDTRVELRLEGEGWHEAPVEVLLPATGRAYGAELLLRRRPGSGRLWGWLALSAGRSLRLTEEGTFPSAWDEPLALALLGAWEISDRARVSARLRVASGHPFTPQLGAYDPGDDAWEAVTGPTYGDRYPAFRQLDLRWERDLAGRRRDWQVFVDLLNATWADNPIAPVYSWDYSELLTLVSLPIVPNAGLACRF